MQRQKATLVPGLRWSPQPAKHYTAQARPGSAISNYLAAFQLNPAVWNLFWITAAGLEQELLTDRTATGLFEGACGTSQQDVQGRPVKSWVVSMMPDHFADLLEHHPEEAEKLRLSEILGPRWVWVIRHRAQLFYDARTSEQGRPILLPEFQDETNEIFSTTIVELSRFRGRPRV